jgi:hypothetical protein
MRPWTAGQKRFSLRTSQIAQLNRRLSSLHYGIAQGIPPLRYGADPAIFDSGLKISEFE